MKLGLHNAKFNLVFTGIGLSVAMRHIFYKFGIKGTVNQHCNGKKSNQQIVTFVKPFLMSTEAVKIRLAIEKLITNSLTDIRIHENT